MKHERGFEILEHTIETVTFDPFAGAGCKEIERFGDAPETWVRALVKGPNGKTIAFATQTYAGLAPLDVIATELGWDDLALAALGCPAPEFDEPEGIAGPSLHEILRYAPAQVGVDPGTPKGDRTAVSMHLLAQHAQQVSSEALRAIMGECPIGNTEPVSAGGVASALPSGKITRPEWLRYDAQANARRFRFGNVVFGDVSGMVSPHYDCPLTPAEQNAVLVLHGLPDIETAFNICANAATRWSQL